MRTIQSIAVALAMIIGIGLSVPSQSAQPAPFTEAELDQMLAPVALYPDTVLSHVLIAATYPLEVVQAARWSRHNPSMRGEEAVAAVERQNWDPSVKALVAFPELLARMDEDLEWTQRLGDAFLMQEEEVVDTVQYLRSEAYSQGHLKSNDHVRVVRETQYIYIEPARTRVVYVPYYDPRVVYTRWRWSSHPPVYWHHPPAYRSSVVFYWGPAYRVAPSFYFSSFHWSRRQVVSVHHHHHHYHRHVHTHRHFSSGREIARHSSARHWQHNPTHRRGVSYRPGTDQRRFVQQQRDSATSVRSASARASSPQRARTISQQRQWADQQRSAAPLRERSQARSSEARTSQRSDAASRIQRDAGSSSPATTRHASRARSEASAPRTATRSEATASRTTTPGEASTPRSAAIRSDNRGENRTQRTAPARAATTRPDSGARTAARTTTAPRSEATRPQAQASAPASSQRQSPSATVRQAQAPRAAQSTRQPQTSSSPAASRQSQPAWAPSTQSSAPARSTATPPSNNTSRSSAAPRASASAPTSRSGATTRSSNPRGGDSRRAARRVD